MQRLAHWYWIVDAVGWENVPRRAWHVLETRLGLKRRRLPGGELSSERLAAQFQSSYAPAQAAQRWEDRRGRFFATQAEPRVLAGSLEKVVTDERWAATAAAEVAAAAEGRYLFFSRRWSDLGAPPRFNHDPLHGVDWPVGRHWTTYRQFDAALADLKCVWEPSRFAWAFALTRDHVRSQGRSQAARLFWQTLAEWDAQNPYGLTPQWICGQEGTFRLMAWLFAALVTGRDAPPDTASLARLTELVWYTGRHIDENILYARSQKNNHAISEAVGLWTIGLMFPELRSADAWRRRGRAVLGEEISRQLYADGSYVQHSLVYHRVMLDDLLWAVALGRSAGEPVDELSEPLRRATDWLREMVDPKSGAAPNYGSNDGASVLPLSSCDYRDFRPTLQAAHFALQGERCLAPGPWDEKLVWLFGPEALESPVTLRARSRSFAATDGGYYTLAGERSWGMCRVHTYRDRPGQADMLHFDLWFDGQNVLRDAGSYHYFAPQPWHGYFASTAAHNTIEIDGQDQMVRGPNFLWLRWTRAKLLECKHSADGQLGWLVGEHYGYARLAGRVTHRRSILRIQDSYAVIDDVRGRGRHEAVLRWRLINSEWRERADGWVAEGPEIAATINVAASTGAEASLVRGQCDPRPEGWESLYYAEKTAVPSLIARVTGELPLRFITVCSLGDRPLLSLTQGNAIRASKPARLMAAVEPEMAQAVAALTSGKVQLDLSQP